MDQQRAQIFVAALGDPQKPWLAAGRMLPWNEAEPSAKITPTRESRPIAYGGDEGRGVQGADPGDRDQTAARLVDPGVFDEFPVEGADTTVKYRPLLTQLDNETTDAAVRHELRVGDQRIDAPLQFAASLGDGHSALEQNGA